MLTMKLFEKLPKPALEKKRLFHNMLEYWNSVIIELKPEVIIFALWPHATYNFVAYSLAKHHKIKIILFEYARIADRLLLINDFTLGSPALRDEIKNNAGKMHTVDNLSSDIRDYYLNQLNKGSDITPPDIKILSGRYRGFNLFRLKIKAVFFVSGDLFRKNK